MLPVIIDDTKLDGPTDQYEETSCAPVIFSEGQTCLGDTTVDCKWCMHYFLYRENNLQNILVFHVKEKIKIFSLNLVYMLEIFCMEECLDT